MLYLRLLVFTWFSNTLISGHRQRDLNDTSFSHLWHIRANSINGTLDYDNLFMRSYQLFNSSEYTTSIMISLFEELLYRMMPVWTSSPNAGYYIKTSEELIKRMNKVIQETGRNCRNSNSNTILYMCTYTKNDGSDLQEWLLWQLLVVGVKHVILYLNGPDEDNTEKVIKPFIDAGYVTSFIRTGPAQQMYVYNLCLDIIRKKSCYYSGEGSFLNTTDCKAGDDYDVYIGGKKPQDRVVWMAGFDTDEYPITEGNECFSDILEPYADSNGLMIPWYVFGHSSQFLTPKKLVTDSYHYRWSNVGWGKSWNRVYSIMSMKNSHIPYFKNAKLPVNESFYPKDQFYFDKTYFLENAPPAVLSPQYSENKPYTVIHPKYRLYHYQQKSVELLVKKWVKGVSDEWDAWGRSNLRDICEITGWFKQSSSRSGRWTVFDNRTFEMVSLIKKVVFNDFSNENRHLSIEKSGELHDNTLKHKLDFSPLDYSRTVERAKKFTDHNCAPLMLGIMSELMNLKSTKWIASMRGYRIRNEESLKLALTESEYPCKKALFDVNLNKTVVGELTAYTVSKYDDSIIQEWLLWNIVNTGISHFYVYLPDVYADHTVVVVHPFVMAGYVTLIDMVAENITDIHSHFRVNLMSARRDISDWVVYLPINEYVVPESHSCFVHQLFLQNSNTINLNQYIYGHDGHFLSQSVRLVSETFLHRLPEVGSNYTVFTRSNSLLNPVQDTIVLNLSRINRYETLSVEHTIKLWAVGEPLAPYDTFGKREQKSIQSVIDLISKFTTANVLLDDSALFGASVVRSLLSHKLVSEFS